MALDTFATKLTATPDAFRNEDRAAIQPLFRDFGEYIEAVNVVAGFNFANRVADGLGISSEVPPFLRRWRTVYALARTVMSRLMRSHMNFGPRSLPAPSPDETLNQLSAMYQRREMGHPPSYLRALSTRPVLLDLHAWVQRMIIDSDVLEGSLVRKLGYLVSTLNGDMGWAEEWRSVLGLRFATKVGVQETVEQLACSETEAGALKFGWRLTADASMTSDDDVRSIARLGYTDLEILALVLVVAGFNAGNRLNVALTC